MIDVHTHLGRSVHLQSTAEQLVASMDQAGIDQSLVFLHYSLIIKAQDEPLFAFKTSHSHAIEFQINRLHTIANTMANSQACKGAFQH